MLTPWIKKTGKVIPIAFLIFTLTFRVDYRLDAPGNLEPLDDFITFESVSQDPKNLHAVYVMSYQRPTVFQWILAQWIPSIDVTPIPPSQTGITNQDRFVSGQVSRNSAIEASVLTAFLALDEPIEYEIQWLLSLFRSEQKDQGLVIGDQLIAVDGYTDNLLTRLNEWPCEEAVVITFKGEETYDVTLTKNVDGCLLGLQFTTYYNITSVPVAYTVESSLVGGPSAGMMQTLYVYASLTDVSWDALKIAGTGTIFINGQVGSIGAVRQKIYTAHQENVDVFFVPAGSNYDEAFAVYETLRNPSFDLVPVATFEDILTYLEGQDVEN